MSSCPSPLRPLGSYHDIGAFISDGGFAKNRDLHDFEIIIDGNGSNMLEMAKTYRYREEDDEI